METALPPFSLSFWYFWSRAAVGTNIQVPKGPRWFVPRRETTRLKIRRFKSVLVIDSFFLFAAVLFSTLPYVAKLGFYSDDWYNLAVLSQHSNKGISAEIHGLYEADRTMMQRPVQALYFAVAFKVFGMHALPYHLLNVAAIGAATVLLYLTTRELSAERWVPFLIALGFGLVPHYSTDRFWFTMQHANLSVAFAFLGTWFTTRAVSQGVRNPAKWFAVGAALFTLSFLSYEVMLGWIAASIGFVIVRSYLRSRRTVGMKRVPRSVIVVIIPLVITGMLKVLTQKYISRHHHFLGNLGLHARDALEQAIQFNFWSFGLKMPLLLVTLYRHSALSWNSVVLATILAVLVIAYLWCNLDPSSIPSPPACARLVLIGLFVFALGYALFFAVPQDTFEFTSTGLDNRVAIASAPGAACMLVALAGLACAPLKSQRWRLRCFSFLIGAICLANCLVVDGIAFYWMDAAAQQSQILRSLAVDAPSLPAGSVLLLDGFCRYSGPGFIFEADGDATGAIRILLKDPTLRSDVMSPDVHFDRTAVDTSYYGAPEQQYPYGRQLLVYNVRFRRMRPLLSQSDAQNYLRTPNRYREGGCPAGRDGSGEKIF